LDYEGDDVEYVFCLTFEVTWSNLGQEQKIELKPGGSDIPVTSDNREEYVLLYVKWLLVDSIQPQWDAFEKGIRRVMESSSLDLFRPEELELLVVGTPELDFEALEANAEYEGGYDKDSAVIKNFWRFVKESDLESQLKFLRFATGSSKAPIGGLGEMPFKIQRAGPDSPQLPTSHTCFNTLLLPDYGDDYDKLSRLLGRAIIECEGFGLE
jgi:ubiquitin-protein ligase E3 A/E3 ubiquitin-protein ligase HERC4